MFSLFLCRKSEKKKVYFEDGIYPDRDSEDEDRKLIEAKIRRKILRLRKQRGIELTKEARELLESTALKAIQNAPIDPALEKLPPPAPPVGSTPPAHLEQPICLRPPTPVPMIYFHFDAVVHSMYVSQMEKAIPPRLLNASKYGGGVPNSNSSNGSGSSSVQSPCNRNSPNAAAVGKKSQMSHGGGRRGDLPTAASSSNKPMHFASGPSLGGSPQMSPLQHANPVMRPHSSPPVGFVGMRINSFTRLPPSPLARFPGPSAAASHTYHQQLTVCSSGGGIRQPLYNVHPPNMLQDITTPPPPSTSGGFIQHQQRPIAPPNFAVGFGTHPNMHTSPTSPSLHSMQHPPPAIPYNAMHVHNEKNSPIHHPSPPGNHGHAHKPSPQQTVASSALATSPHAMIAPYNVKKTVN